MKILVDWGGYSLANLGDIAMMQTTVSNIQKYCPFAKIFIITSTEEDLEFYFPGTYSVSSSSRDSWFNAKLLPIPERIIPNRFRKALRIFYKKTKLNNPNLANRFMRLTKLISSPKNETPSGFYEVVRTAKMVIASGGGYISDNFSSHADKVLGTLLIAQKLGIPTAMFGQGIGPINNETLFKTAKNVLPRLKVLGLREGLESIEIVNKLDVPKDRTFVTGDDAIESVINTIKDSKTKDCIGFNIRLADYAGDIEPYLSTIGRTIEEIAKIEKATIIPIPIHIGDSNRDLRAVTRVCSIEESEINIAKAITNPEILIRQISRCRLVITGSYHAGVFALAQGIPVVALVGSDYYAAKFYGLANQFKGGVEIVQIGSSNLIESLRDSLMSSLTLPEDDKSKLVENANLQIELSRKAWKRFLSYEFDQ